VQIAGIKERLKLSRPGILLAGGGKRVARVPARFTRPQGRSNAAGVPIDPDAEEVQQLKSAAMPLLFSCVKIKSRKCARSPHHRAGASRLDDLRQRKPQG